MDKLQLLASALSFIEEKLLENINTEDIAAHCYCSRSSIEKLFRNVNNISVHDYMVRRKMVIAARILRSGDETNLLNLALSLGYNSNEAFTRAFKQVWNCNPSEFVDRYCFTELFPRFSSTPLKGEFSMKKNVDISELYDLFRERKDCYFICCDIMHLIPINDISHKAGDLAILEEMKRVSEAAGEDDVVFRIGGDECVMLTDTKDLAYAEEIAEKIRAKNGETIQYKEHQIPVNLYVVVTKFDSPSLKYNELFSQLHSTIEKSKRQSIQENRADG